jgi:hypothetical protein
MCTSLWAFDLHRTGSFQRRTRWCLTEQAMLDKGMVKHVKGWWMRSAFDGELPWSVSDDELEEVS